MPCPSPGLEPQLPQLGKIRIRGRELLRLDNLLSTSSLETWTVQITDHFHFQGMKITVSNAYFACKAFPINFERQFAKLSPKSKSGVGALQQNLEIYPFGFQMNSVWQPLILLIKVGGRLQTPRQLETLGSKVKWGILNRDTPTTPNNEETGFSNNF